MTPADFLTRARSNGFTFELQGDRIRVTPPEGREPRPEGLAYLRENKAAFVRLLQAENLARLEGVKPTKTKPRISKPRIPVLLPTLKDTLKPCPSLRPSSILWRAFWTVRDGAFYPTPKGWAEGNPRPMLRDCFRETHRGRLIVLRRVAAGINLRPVPPDLVRAWTTILSRLIIDRHNQQQRESANA